MRRMGKWGISVLIILLVLSLAAGCGDKSAQNQGQGQGEQKAQLPTVVAAAQPDYKTMDPGHAYELYGNMVLRGMYETLVKAVGEQKKVEPYLAKEWKISGDGKEYTFTLREGVKFASGNPLTSEDVRFSITRLKNLKGTPSFLAEGIERVEAPDPTTVKIILKQPEGALLTKLTQSPFGILDSKVVKEKGGTDAVGADKSDSAQPWLDSHSAGSGPFILEKYTPKEELVLVRNEKYWGTPVKIGKLVIKEISDHNTQMMMLQKGDIDVAFDLTADQIKVVQSDPKVKLIKGETLDMFFLLMNQDPKIGGPFANEQVRQAIRYAIDYKGIQALAGNNAITPYSIIPVGFQGAIKQEPITDVEKAKQLLAQAGYPNGFSAKMEVATYTVSSLSFVTMAQKVQEDLSKIGIKLTLETGELSVMLPRYRDGKQGFSLWMWGPDYPDPANQLAFLPGEAVGKRANWKESDDPDLNKLGKQAMAESKPEKRVALLEEIQKRTAQKGPWVVFVQPGRVIGTRSNLSAVYDPVFLIDINSLTK